MTRTDYWNRFNARQRAIEKKFIGSVYKEVRGQYNSFLNAVKSHGYEYAKKHIHQIVNAEGIVKVLKKLYRYSAYIEGNYVLSSLIKKKAGRKSLELKRIGNPQDASFGIGFDEIADVVDQYFKIYALNISGLPIARTTVKEIQNHLIAEVERGVDLNDAIRNFRELALTSGDHPERVISRRRARNIIQTESLRAMSFGGLIGAYKSGVDVDKVWVTCNDEKVRGAAIYPHARFKHTELDGQMTSLFGAFYNGEKIKFPGDPEAHRSNTINCRCTNFYQEKAKPKPRIIGVDISKFLTDFFLGFFAGSALADAVMGTGQAQIVNEQ